MSRFGIIKNIISSFIPPLLLLYLIYKPTLAAGVFSQFLCFLIIIIAVLTLMQKAIKNRKNKFNAWLYARSTFAVIISVIVIFVLRENDNKARSYLWQVAEEVQNQCVLNSECPKYPKDWTNNNKPVYGFSPSNSQYTNLMFYQSGGSRDTFAVFIHYGPDFDYWIRGGVKEKPHEYIPEQE